jgi:hypothetical protein
MWVCLSSVRVRFCMHRLTALGNRPARAPCATCYGRTRPRTLATRPPTSCTLTTAPADAPTFTRTQLPPPPLSLPQTPQGRPPSGGRLGVRVYVAHKCDLVPISLCAHVFRHRDNRPICLCARVRTLCVMRPCIPIRLCACVRTPYACASAPMFPCARVSHPLAQSLCCLCAPLPPWWHRRAPRGLQASA